MRLMRNGLIQSMVNLELSNNLHRDGIIGTAEQQAAETLAATTAHTQMALRMLDDGKAIQMTENLDMDITAYKLSQYLGDESIFAGYVAGSYDASADYWKLMDDGTLVNDGSGWLTDEHGRAIRNKDGNILPDYREYYKTYNNLHYGIDLVIDSGKDDILLGFSGKVYLNEYNEAEGYTVQMKYGYNFEDSFIDLGIYGEYGHLKEKSHLIKNQFYSGKEKVGLFGNTGTKTTGAHLHYSVYTQDNVSFSDTTMKLLLGLDYSKDSMYNGSWRTIYNPSKLFETYRDKQ